ncbi:hypothetical protein BD626DRAFT_632560 [Schizophyllum amplum]|uniref:Uncharacterized protein n=1 Tax=Schizophyllum amplum TaxID=97359 RepID=A0A550C6M0_9AGAR|nr:hypothetical protein BD626DRAFT_632560 [Auriculariopsis ampla]
MASKSKRLVLRVPGKLQKSRPSVSREPQPRLSHTRPTERSDVQDPDVSSDTEEQPRKRSSDRVLAALEKYLDGPRKRPRVDDRSSPLYPYLHGARGCVCDVPYMLFGDLESVFMQGIHEAGLKLADDVEEDAEARAAALNDELARTRLEKQRSIAFNVLAEKIPSLRELLAELVAYPELYMALVIMMQDVQNDGKCDDTAIIKREVIKYARKDPKKKKRIMDDADIDNKSKRGLNVRNFGYGICTRKHYDAMLEDYERSDSSRELSRKESLPALEATRDEREAAHRELKRAADVARKARERSQEKARKKTAAMEGELAALDGRAERLQAKRTKLEGTVLPDLEEQLRVLERELQRAEMEELYGGELDVEPLNADVSEFGEVITHPLFPPRTTPIRAPTYPPLAGTVPGIITRPSGHRPVSHHTAPRAHGAHHHRHHFHHHSHPNGKAGSRGAPLLSSSSGTHLSSGSSSSSHLATAPVPSATSRSQGSTLSSAAPPFEPGRPIRTAVVTASGSTGLGSNTTAVPIQRQPVH